MEARKRVKKMEDILHRQLDLMASLRKLLGEVEASQADFEALLAYYQSQTYMEDLSLEEKGHFMGMTRGVLSEDGVYNLLFDRGELAEKLREVGELLQFSKKALLSSQLQQVRSCTRVHRLGCLG